MRDFTIGLENRPGALDEMGEALGMAGVGYSDPQNQLILVVSEL